MRRRLARAEVFVFVGGCFWGGKITDHARHTAARAFRGGGAPAARPIARSPPRGPTALT